MAETPPDRTRFSLRRWSQRKLDAARTGAAPEPADAARSGDTDAARTAAALHHGARVVAAPPAQMSETQTFTAPPEAFPAAAPADAQNGGSRSQASVRAESSGQPSPLPSPDTLTIDSDFSGFMRPGVDDSLKRSALKKLFSDPRFNVMDGLDVYIDDYSKPDPIEPDLVRTLVQAKYIFNPPATQLNPDGYVEDVPDLPDDRNADAGADQPAPLSEPTATAPSDADPPALSGARPIDSARMGSSEDGDAEAVPPRVSKSS
jgi:hypothetical protein